MNKYQEALDYLASLWEIEGEITVKSDPFDRFNRVETLIEDKVRRADREKAKILQELVDKETPMRVGSYTGSEWKFRGRFICPRCNKILLIRNLPIRCDSCGQKLDFGGE